MARRFFTAFGMLFGLLVGVLLLAGLLVIADSHRLSDPPPYLDILLATIEEVPPIMWGEPEGRTVVLRIVVAGPPDFAVANELSYGFLIDADKDQATGTSSETFNDLGVDYRIHSHWNPQANEFVSSLGATVVTTDSTTGETIIEIFTTVGALPSHAFRWIAYAVHADVLTRLPAAPSHGAWATHEESLY